MIRLIAVYLFCALTVPGGIAAASAPPSPAQTNLTARVVISQSPGTVTAFRPKPEKVRPLMDRAILQFTGQPRLAAAWRSLISTNDIIGLKVFSVPGPSSGTRPSVVAAVIEGLVASGINPAHIVIWDKHLEDLRAAGFDLLAAQYKVRLAGAAQAGYDSAHFYDSPILGNPLFGDADFGKKGATVGRRSYVSRLLTSEVTKIISIAPLLNHNLAGVSGSLCNVALGAVDNTFRFETPDRMATALPEIYALPEVGDRVILNIIDALICQYQGEQTSLLHYARPLNQIWIGKDPVALDVLALDELDRQRRSAEIPPSRLTREIYQNASLLELGISDSKKVAIDFQP